MKTCPFTFIAIAALSILRDASAASCSAINSPCADNYEWYRLPKPDSRWKTVSYQQELGDDESPRIPCPIGGGGDGGGGDCPTCPSPTGGAPTDAALAAWSVTMPNINLRITDSPLFYTPARGLPLRFQLAYRQRGAVDESPIIFGTGTNWSCSFRAFVVDVRGGTNGPMRLHRVGIGVIDYTLGVNNFFDGSLLTTPDSGVTYEVAYSDGPKLVFGKSFVASGLTYYFLTAQKDPAGNAHTFNYSADSTIARLTSVQDPDGNSTLLYYENATFTNQITKVVSPYGGTNVISYDSSGYLTNISDVVGLSTGFTYDAGTRRSWITNMNTPYGNTGFKYGGLDVESSTFNTGGNVVNRSVEVTLPTGGKHLYLYRQDCSAFLPSSYSPIPSTGPLSNTLDNVDQQNRNSFHWDPAQYGALSSSNPSNFTSADYAVGHLYHWLTNSSAGYGPNVVSLERFPSPDGSTNQLALFATWYDYDGKSPANNYNGNSALRSLKAIALPDGASTRYERFARNGRGNATQSIALTAPLTAP